MLTPWIQRIASSRDPFQVYQNLSQTSKTSFFLDSPQYQEPDQRFSLLGAAPSLELVLTEKKLRISGETNQTVAKTEFFPVLRRLLRSHQIAKISSAKKCGIPFIPGALVGYFAYEFVADLERIHFRKKKTEDNTRAHLGLYRDLILFDHRQKAYFLCVLAKKGERAAEIESRLSHLQKQVESTSSNASKSMFKLHGFRAETSREEFARKVQKAKNYIAAGDIYQANLSQRFLFEYQGDPLEIYARLREINPSPFASFLRFGNRFIVSSSPERLIRKRGYICETRPIAGTRPLRVSSGTVLQKRTVHGRTIEQELLANEKERAEHIMLVDLERNDLGRVCNYRSVQVEEMMTTERYSHVVHIVSKITGKLREDKDGLDLVRAMFPGGTITGCPKIRCMEIIDELEKSSRGIYTGSIGYLGFDGDLDLNIVIRTLVLEKNKGVLQVGAGIVYDSDPRKEYEETLHKAEALVEALAFASQS